MHGDICDEELVDALLGEERPDAIVHFAAESHVDRSILSPEPVIQTNLRGTFTLLEAARRHRTPRFLHVSTDEVYGSLAAPLEATEEFPLNPSSPYSASKAGVRPAGALLLRHLSAAGGDYARVQQLRAVPVSGEADPADDRQRARRPAAAGLRRRHAGARLAVSWTIIAAASWRCSRRAATARSTTSAATARCRTWKWSGKLLKATGKPESLIQYVTDRPGHDRRYALSSEKILRETGWRPDVDFEKGLARTIDWYRSQRRVGGARAQRRVSRLLRAELREPRGICARAAACAWRLRPRRWRFRAEGWRGTPANSAWRWRAAFPDDEFFLISDQPFRDARGLSAQPEAGRRRRAMPLERRWWLWGIAREMGRLGADGPRPGFRGALSSPPAQRADAARSVAVDGTGAGTSAPDGSNGALRVLLELGIATMIVTPSEAVRKQAIERFRLHPTALWPCRRPPRRWFRPVERRPGTPYFLFVGTLEPRKNLPALIEAWREVRRAHPVELVAGRAEARRFPAFGRGAGSAHDR